ARCLLRPTAVGASSVRVDRRLPRRARATCSRAWSPECSARIPILSRPPGWRPGPTPPPASAGEKPIRCSVASRRPGCPTSSRSPSMRSPEKGKSSRLDYRAAIDRFRRAARDARATRILSLFDAEGERLDRLSFDVAALRIDLSRQRLPLAALEAWGDLVEASGLVERRAAMFAGEAINFTEQRAAFHVALRAPAGTPRPLGRGGPDVGPEADDTLRRMREFSRRVREGEWVGAHARPITDVVHVGIGGSQLGPLLACDALAAYRHPRLRVHFLANIDPDAWARLQPGLVPDTTLVVIASKSWRTVETARNALAVRDWLMDGGIEEPDLARHLVGVTANPQGARAFGLADEGIFPFSDWVGGRYS